MKKILKALALTLLIPGLALAAFNDVTLTTDVVLTSNSISLAVYGSSATLESITVDSGSFNVTLASGSSIEVRSADRKVIEASPAGFITTNVCSSSESRIKLENSGSTATITITPSSTTCVGSAHTSSVSGGGGPAPACEDSIDNDKDGLIDIKDPGCAEAAEADETNVATAATSTTPTATSTAAVATSTSATATITSPTIVKQTAAAGAVSQEVMNLVNQLRSLMTYLKSLGGTVSPSLEATILSLTGTPASGGAFTRDLKVGMTRDDVKMLQAFLNTHGYSVASQGPGSPGNETIVFGAATRAALIKFQKANTITPAAGYFGPKTRDLVNSMQ